MELRVFTYDNLKSFTNNFDDTNFIGKFQFGRLFHGMIGLQLEEMSFLTHPTGKHPNLVKLIGYCSEGENLGVVYHLKALGILHDLLLKDDFSWLQRIKVALGFAFILKNLHEESSIDLPYLFQKIGDVNIMLDQDYNPKLCDFGMISCGIFPDKRHMRTHYIWGCYGYIDPYCASRGALSHKSDVFAFGVILLNLIAKRIYRDEERKILATMVNEWAENVYDHKFKCSLVHQSLETGPGFYSSDGVNITELGIICGEYRPQNRPTMREVVKCLLKLHVVHGHADYLSTQQKHQT